MSKSGKPIVRRVFTVVHLTCNAINQGRPAMPEKLVQAAIITFLLHLIAGLSPNSSRIQTRVISPTQDTPATLVSFLWRPFK